MIDFHPQIVHLYWHSPSPVTLEKMVQWLSRKGYRFVSADELCEVFALPENDTKEKLCMISLDDGYRSNLELIPVCENYNVPITVFVTTGALLDGNFWFKYVNEYMGPKATSQAKRLDYESFNKLVEKAKSAVTLPRLAMTEQELKDFSRHRLVTIGSHTVTHPILTELPPDVLYHELEQSKIDLESILGKPCEIFSYPNGTFGDREVTAVRSIYKMAFTTEQRPCAANDDIFLLPRFGLVDGYAENKLKFYGIWPILKKMAQFFHIR